MPLNPDDVVDRFLAFGAGGVQAKTQALVDEMISCIWRNPRGLTSREIGQQLPISRTSVYYYLKADGSGKIQESAAEFNRHFGSSLGHLTFTKSGARWILEVRKPDGSPFSRGPNPVVTSRLARPTELAEEWANRSYSYEFIVSLDSHQDLRAFLRSPPTDEDCLEDDEPAFCVAASLHFGTAYEAWARAFRTHAFACRQALHMLENRLNFVRPALRAVLALQLFEPSIVRQQTEVIGLSRSVADLLRHVVFKGRGIGHLRDLVRAGGEIGRKAELVLSEGDARSLADRIGLQRSDDS